MPQVQITDFKYGMDRRRKRAVGTPGSLWTLKNAHVSRGGDIERMKKWAVYAPLPAGTFGLNTVYGQLITFGSEDLAAQMPFSVAYQRLTPPAGTHMTGILDSQVFGDNLYVVARFSDGSIHHYYNAVRVSDWDNIAEKAINPAWVVYELGVLASDNSATSVLASGRVLRFTANAAGTAFTLAATGASAQIIPRVVNVPPVAEVAARATITVASGPAALAVPDPFALYYLNSLIIEGAEMIHTPILWDGSVNNMANAITLAIAEYGLRVGVTASFVGNVVTVSGTTGKGASLNGHTMSYSADAGIVLDLTAFAGGVTEVKAVAQVTDVSYGGTIDKTTVLTVTVNGTAYTITAPASNMGTNVMAYKQRMWACAGTLLRYSKLNDPALWSVADAGYIDMPTEGEGAERLTTMARYDQQVAVFGGNQIRLWALDVDPLKNAAGQTLNNTGTGSPLAVVQYGDMDVFYLDTPGIRSLKARTGVTTAAVNDVGTALDTWLQEIVRVTPRNVLQRSVGIMDPLDGRYLLALGDKMIVLSAFANSKVSAWSYYEPGFSANGFARLRRSMFARDDTNVYLYGGISGSEYPAEGESVISVETPFISANAPGVFKILNAFMAVCTNVWDVSMLLDPDDETKEVWIGKVTGVTFREDQSAIEGATNLVALRMTCDQAGEASFSSFLIDFNKTP